MRFIIIMEKIRHDRDNGSSFNEKSGNGHLNCIKYAHENRYLWYKKTSEIAATFERTPAHRTSKYICAS